MVVSIRRILREEYIYSVTRLGRKKSGSISTLSCDRSSSMDSYLTCVFVFVLLHTPYCVYAYTHTYTYTQSAPFHLVFLGFSGASCLVVRGGLRTFEGHFRDVYSAHRGRFCLWPHLARFFFLSSCLLAFLPSFYSFSFSFSCPVSTHQYGVFRAMCSILCRDRGSWGCPGVTGRVVA